MHEYELGIWKSLFAHLVRILEAVDTNMVDELNERYESCVYSSVARYHADQVIMGSSDSARFPLSAVQQSANLRIMSQK